jgi:hypothetical protein
MIRLVFVLLVALVIGCSGGGSGSDSGNGVSWTIAVDTSGSGSPLNPALLGHYDLSGVLYSYPNVSGLAAAMSAVGFAEWRVGAGRWEQATELLPNLTDSSACPATSGIFSETAATDDALMAARDWFTYTDGSIVSLGDTADDGRYDLGYIRSVIDTAELFDATPFLSIDHMPRALSINQTANRLDCVTTFMNAVSNNQPQDAAVFASAVSGLVQRVVEGTGTRAGDERPRNVSYWEVWNEPELRYFWKPDWEEYPNLFFDMAVPVLVQLDAYRTSSGHSELKFGLGSFAFEATAVTVLSAFDAVPVPMDFISFHGYDDDPLVLVDKIDAVASAAQSSTNYTDIEIVLAEWGPDLETHTSDQAYAAGMEPPLHAATVIALGAAAGLDRTHHALFYDYHPTLALGLVDNNDQPRTLYRGYELMAKVIVPGAERLAPSGLSDGRLDSGMGAVLVSRDGSGTVRILLVNRNSSERSAIVELDGSAATPSTIYAFDGTDDPIDPLRTVTPTGPKVVMPANSLMVLVFF